MKTNFKVAGTTFRPLPAGAKVEIMEEFVENNVPCARAQALLQPEPTNEHDPEAVKVIVKLTDGSPFHIGYVPRTEPLKTQIKKLTAASMVIRDYGQMGYNPSFLITEVSM